jgi:hypothetical protein
MANAANIVKLKRSAVAGKAPNTADLQLGELALNTYDGRLFFTTTQDSGSTYNLTTLQPFPTGGSSGQILSLDSSGNLIWSTTSGTGTVTSVSVVSANGFTGTVATSGTTPAITIATSVTGLLKGNGTSISAATASTDYVIPSDLSSYLTASSTLDASKLSGTIPSTVLGNSTVYIGTTAVALNRSSAIISLTGTSIDGNAATVTDGVYTTGSYSDPTWLTITKSKVGLGNVENTALSTWAGSTNLTTLGTITSGTWHGTAIANSYLANSTIVVNGVTLTLGDTNDSIKASTTNALTIGTGLSGTSFDGSTAVTIAIDNTVVTKTDTQTLTNKTLTSPTINGATVGGHLLPATNVTYNLGSASYNWDNLYVNKINDLVFSRVEGKTYYVTQSGDDISTGTSIQGAFATIKKALTVVSAGDSIKVGAGTYTEIFPLTVPVGVSIVGLGIRSTKIVPTTGTKNKDAFLLSGEIGLSDFTVADFFYDSVNDTGYAFRFVSGAVVAARSPYLQRITVLCKGSNPTASDPYGFLTGDAGRGALIDGSQVTRASIEAAMLFNECTFIVPNSRALIMKNGARAEWLTCFTYFADLAIEGLVGATGRGGSGKTYLTLSNTTGTWNVGNTLSYYANDGTTLLASATIEDINGSIYQLAGSVSGFTINSPRTAKIVTVNGDAKLSTAQQKFGTASLFLDGTGDYATVASNVDFAFGTGAWTIECWIYRSVSGAQHQILDFRTIATQNAPRLYITSANILGYYVNGAARITGGTVSSGAWHHVAISKSGTSTKLFLDGVQTGSTYTDATNYIQSPLTIGAQYDGAGAFNGYIDEVRISKGVARYTTTFTAPTAAFVGDLDTVLLLHFNGTNASTTFLDAGANSQDIRSSGGGTATGITRYDRKEFAAELRSISSVNIYGNQGVKADGVDVKLQLMAHNFAYIGTGADLTNNSAAVVQANEVIEVNSGRVYYNTVDQSGNYRVGQLFSVNFETGAVTFSGSTFDVSSLVGINFTDGTNSTIVDATHIATGNLVLAGNTISSQTGSITIDPSGSQPIYLNGDTTVTGNFAVSSTITSGIWNGSAITNSYLANSTIVVNGVTLTLGDTSDTIKASTTNALTIGTGLTGTSFDGSSAVTIAVDTTTIATRSYVTGLNYITLASLSMDTPASASGSGNVQYDSATGKFKYTPPDLSSYITASVATLSSLTSIGTTGVDTTAAGNLIVSGNLTVNGTTETINSTTSTFADKNIELAKPVSPATASDSGANGGGITLHGTTDKTLNWVLSTLAWTSSENFDIANNKTYKINGTDVLSSTALGTAVTGSSLTSVGTITSGTWHGTAIANSYLANSTIVVNGVTLTLGDTSDTIKASTTNALTIGTGLSGTSFDGSSAVTIALATGYGDTQNPYGSKTTKYILAAPNSTNGAPTFRALVASDIPTLNQDTTGNAGTVTNGVYTTGSYADPGWITSLSQTKVLPTQTSNNGFYLTTNGTTATWTAFPTASTTQLGGVKVDGTTITINNGVISSAGSGGGSLTTSSFDYWAGILIMG